MSPYRTPPPAPKLAPRTSWHRLAWAFCRGVFVRIDLRKAERHRFMLVPEFSSWEARHRYALRKGRAFSSGSLHFEERRFLSTTLRVRVDSREAFDGALASALEAMGPNSEVRHK